MGIYNCAPTLQAALDSLYAQTYQDFEIIMCDDGSIDDTYHLALENSQKHPNIVLIRNSRNLGLGQTLNNCLAVAKGEYIARMDGDDLCDSTRFEKQVEFLDEHAEFAIVSSPMFYFDSNGVFGQGKGGQAPSVESFIYGTPHPHAPCMVRREAYLAVEGYSADKRLLRNEDYNLWMKMYAIGFRGYNLDECLYYMRDDRNATRRRNWTGRRNEAYSRWLACRTLHLPIKGYFYCLRPIVLYFLPTSVYEYFHKRKLNQVGK